jgi:hypothetical protein
MLHYDTQERVARDIQSSLFGLFISSENWPKAPATLHKIGWIVCPWPVLKADFPETVLSEIEREGSYIFSKRRKIIFTLMQWSSLPKSITTFTPKKFYRIDSRCEKYGPSCS